MPIFRFFAPGRMLRARPISAAHTHVQTSVVPCDDLLTCQNFSNI
jgi:hypothetical protein